MEADALSSLTPMVGYQGGEAVTTRERCPSFWTGRSLGLAFWAQVWRGLRPGFELTPLRLRVGGRDMRGARALLALEIDFGIAVLGGHQVCLGFGFGFGFGLGGQVCVAVLSGRIPGPLMLCRKHPLPTAKNCFINARAFTCAPSTEKRSSDSSGTALPARP